MTIARRMAIGFAWIAAASLALDAWLAYHEFVEEPAEFAAMGAPNIHKDTEAEFSTVCFLAAVPVLLGAGGWWMRRVLAPLKTLASAVERMDSHNLQLPLPVGTNGDEIDTLSNSFRSLATRLAASFRRIHEFTLHASHELKTPLTVMHAQLETALRESKSLPPGQTEWIEGQLDEIRRLAQIVDSLTLLTKADAGLIELERGAVALGELVQEAFDDAEILAQSRDVQVTLGECADVALTGDRHRLRQLLLILTDNAVKYNRRGGTISLSLRQVGDTGELRITNTGSVLDRQALEHVFERFARGENARGKVDGCGLGLTIARWIVQAHGGTIDLNSDTHGIFTALVRVPLAAVPQRAPENISYVA